MICRQKFLILTAVAVVLLFGCDMPNAASPPEAGMDSQVVAGKGSLPNFISLVKLYGPAVLHIRSTRDYRGKQTPGLASDEAVRRFLRRFGLENGVPQEYFSQSLGSGFIIDREGYILTNAHLIEDASEITVRMIDEREFKAELIGSDLLSDIALLKIPARNLPVLSIGDASLLEVGEWVVAIGAPFGLTNTVTQGIVSAKGRDLPGRNLAPFIQTDVAINPGSSGGPLFNMRGEVVGMNSQILSQHGGSMGISFAIPIDVAMKIKDQLLKHGTVRRGKLGVSIQDLSPELAESFDLEETGGVLISSLEKGGPAKRAGLRIGDVILEFEGKRVLNLAELLRLVSDSAPGTKVRLKIWRDGEAKRIAVVLGEVGVAADDVESAPSGAQLEWFGLSMRELSIAERRAYQTDGRILVESVEGLAAMSGIQAEDIILSINNHPVASLEQLRAELKKSRKRVALLVQRDPGRNIFIALGM